MEFIVKSGHPEKHLAWLDPERTATTLVSDSTLVQHLNLAFGSSTRKLRLASGHTALPLDATVPAGTGFSLTDTSLTRWSGGRRGIQSNAMKYIATKDLVPFGADRNGNGRFDRGKVPKNQRMQAEVVARFNFYDPVMWMSLGR